MNTFITEDKPLVTNLCPGFYRQFRDLNGGGIDDGYFSTVHVLVVQQLLNCAFEALVTWKLWEKTTHKTLTSLVQYNTKQIVIFCPHHGQRLLSVEHTVEVANDLSYVVVGHPAGPSCADTIRTVHQHKGDDGHVPLWLYTLIVIIVVLEQVVIHRWENKAGQRAGRTDSWGNL